jgi:hypothetical protein
MSSPASDSRFVALRTFEFENKHKVPQADSHNEESLCSLTAFGMTLFYSDRTAEVYELPISTPATKTSVPPSTTCNVAETHGVSM